MSLDKVLPEEILLHIGSWLTLIEYIHLSNTCVCLKDTFENLIEVEKKKYIIYLPPKVCDHFKGYFTLENLSKTTEKFTGYSELEPYEYDDENNTYSVKNKDRFWWYYTNETRKKFFSQNDILEMDSFLKYLGYEGDLLLYIFDLLHKEIDI